MKKLLVLGLAMLFGGTSGDYLEFVQTQLQGCLAGISGTSVAFFLSQVYASWLASSSFIFFVLPLVKISTCCTFRLHPLKRSRSPSSNANGSSSSFMETYPHFLAWQYEVMNPDGSFNFMNLDQPYYTPNFPWNDPIYS